MNQAQKLLTSIGVAAISDPKHAHGAKNPSATKAGSGRYHLEGHSKDSPRASAGAPHGFVLHKASAEKQARRNTMAAVGGRRQYLRGIKQALREHREAVAAGFRASRSA